MSTRSTDTSGGSRPVTSVGMDELTPRKDRSEAARSAGAQLNGRTNWTQSDGMFSWHRGRVKGYT